MCFLEVTIARILKTEEAHSDDGSLGAYIRAHRTGKQLTVQALAEQLNVSPGYISKLENSLISKPSEGVRLRLVKLLGLDPILVERLISSRTSKVPAKVFLDAEPLNVDLFSFDQSDIPTGEHQDGPALHVLKSYLDLARAYRQLGNSLLHQSLPNQAVRAYRNTERVCLTIWGATENNAMRPSCEQLLYGTRLLMSQAYGELGSLKEMTAFSQRIAVLYQALDAALSIPNDYIGNLKAPTDDWVIGATGLAQAAHIYRLIYNELSLELPEIDLGFPMPVSYVYARPDLATFQGLEKDARLNAERKYKLIEAKLLDYCPPKIAEIVYNPEPVIDEPSKFVKLSSRVSDVLHYHFIVRYPGGGLEEHYERLIPLQKLGLVSCYRGVNSRDFRLAEDPSGSNDFTESFSLLYLGIILVTSALDVWGLTSSQRLNPFEREGFSILARLHFALAETYIKSSNANRYAEALWNVQIAKQFLNDSQSLLLHHSLDFARLESIIRNEINTDGNVGIKFSEIHREIADAIQGFKRDQYCYSAPWLPVKPS